MLTKAKFLIFHFARLIVRLLRHDAAVAAAKYRFLFSKKPSILSIENGMRRHESKNYALFLIYQPQKIAWYVKNAIDSLNEVGINIIIIVNSKPNKSQLSYLKENSIVVILRDNLGFDIGGFRDSTIYLNSLQIEIDRVIYLNDSIYFFKSGLTDLFARLATTKSDICAPFENWEIHYHIQSFCFSISGRIFRTARFQKFWESYLPVNSRLWAINKGEVGLSRTMVPLAESIDIIYRPNKLRGSLSEIQNLDSRLTLARLIPIPIRSQNSEICSITNSELAQFFIAKIASGSQIHTGGFIYRKYSQCPLIKRDLLYRDQFTIDEIEEALIETGHEGHLDEIMTDFRKKGRSSQLPIVKRLEAASGII